MDASTTSGATVSIVGTVSVFVALTLLYFVVTLLARVLQPDARKKTVAAASPREVDTAAAVVPDQVLAQVAIAAYAMHRSRHVAVRGRQEVSPWLRSGRQRQVGRTDRMR